MLKVVDTCLNIIVYIEYCSSLVQMNIKIAKTTTTTNQQANATTL